MDTTEVMGTMEQDVQAARGRANADLEEVRTRPVGEGRVALYSPLALVVPATAAMVVLRGSARKVRRRNAVASAAIGGAVVLALAAWQLQRLWTERPRYDLERRAGRVDLRRYAPRVVAETEVATTDFDDALEEGFRRLAGYIFGGNDGAQKIAMTAPVQAARGRSSRGESIAMTAPVTSAPAEGGTTIAFGMPRERTLESLPAPRDPRVHLRLEPARRVAALRYRGRYRAAVADAKATELLDAVRAMGLRPVGPVSFAGYDPPSTLPLLRRVEAWVEIE